MSLAIFSLFLSCCIDRRGEKSAVQQSENGRTKRFDHTLLVNSVGERTEHANSIDHEITLNLLKHVGADDASPIVRRELVVALGVVVKVFEANFVAVCRIALEEEGGDGRRSGSAGPQGFDKLIS